MEPSARAITWEAPEHHHVEKGSDWYFSLIIVIVAVVISALVFSNTLFALLMAVSGVALLVLAARKPSIIPFAVTVRGIRVNDELYPYSSLKSFHIDEEDPNGPQLLVLTDHHFMPLLVIPIPEEYIDDIESILRGRLKEELLEEPLFVKILERFGF
ncbi:MAG: hypothetical protein H6779_02465 [Candidatus Nomurabacteria bacterium]|nr:hypothetical protein [Candidatus Nomurabacteria bacterium]USN88285.1 MAG: hypothetical protein H6779_02465 [Candidatus Nomurabacteria bacterium]